METKNLLKSLKRRLSGMLCLVALLCITGRAYAYDQSSVTIYYNNSETKWSSCYFMQGKNNHASRVSMTRVSGTQYLWKCSTGGYNGAEGFRITKQSSGYTDGIWKACWGSDYESTYVYQSAAGSNTIYTTNGYESRKTADCSAGKQEYNWGSTKTNTTYKVTISCGSGGSLTVKDYDDASVNNGASKNYLTVLKITASPNDGYKLKSLTYDGTSISSGDSKTLTKAVTIAAEFEQECVISAYSLGGYLNSADKQAYDSDASFAFVSQGDGTYKLTRSFTSADNYFQVYDNCGNKYGVNTYTENNPATLVKDGNEKVGAKGLTTGVNYNITWNPSTNQIGWSLACTPPSITTQPVSKNYCKDATATALSVVASGTNLQYRWQKSTTSTTEGFQDITGETNSTYTPSTANVGTAYYRCVVSNDCGTDTSSAATIRVDAKAVPGQVYIAGGSSTSTSICSGGSVTLTADPDKVGTVSQWWYKTSEMDDFVVIPNSAQDTYTPENITLTTQYKVSVKNGACGNQGSGNATVTVKAQAITRTDTNTFNTTVDGTETKTLKFTQCGYTITGSNITLVGTNAGEFTLGTKTISGENISVQVTFNPTSTGSKNVYVQILDASHKFQITATGACKSVAAAQYELKNNSYTYDGTNKTVTVTPKTGAGAVSKIMYAGVEGGKTNAGTYAITINSALGDKYCAASGLNVGNLTISKKAPVVGDFNITIPESREYDGTAKAATVVAKGGITGMGAVTVKYNGNTTVPTAAGTYNVTFDVAAGDNYSAENGLSAGTMKITKASRTITLDNTDLINCQTSPFTLTSTVNKGSGDGAVTYQITGGTGVGSIAGSTLSCTTPGTVIVKAKVAEGTNYQADESTTKTFTFQPSSVGGTLAPATADVCYGGSQELTLSGQTGTIQKWQYSYDGTSWNDITSTDNPYNVENIQNNLQLRVVVKSGECAAANSAVSAITVKGAPISIAGSGAKSTSATYPWEYFNFTATTTATDTQITWNCVYSTSLEASKTVFEWSGKTAKLKSGAPASESAHYTVTAKTNVGGCELTSSGYDVYINAAPAEDCGK